MWSVKCYRQFEGTSTVVNFVFAQLCVSHLKNTAQVQSESPCMHYSWQYHFNFSGITVWIGVKIIIYNKTHICQHGWCDWCQLQNEEMYTDIWW